jgi:hypothetical protein
MKKLLTLFVAMVMVLFVISCSEEESNPANPTNPTVTGNWEGTATLLGIGVVFVNTDLSQSGTSISGNAKLKQIGVQDTMDCSVSGNNNYPNVSIIFQPAGLYQPMTFTGSFATNDSLSGKLNGSGASNWDMTFVKQ